MKNKIDGFTWCTQKKGEYLHVIFKKPGERYQISTGGQAESDFAHPDQLRALLHQAMKRHGLGPDAAVPVPVAPVAVAPVAVAPVPAVPATASPAGAGGGKRTRTSAWSLKRVLEKVFDFLWRAHWSHRTAANFRCRKKFLLAALGPGIYNLPIEDVTRDQYAKVAIELEALGLNGSKSQARHELLRLTREMIAHRPGLRPECEYVFSGMEVTSPLLRKGQPYRGDDLRRMLRVRHSQPRAVQFLLWVALSGGPHPCDACTIMRPEIDGRSGKVRFQRQKTGGVAEFFLLPEALAFYRSMTFEVGEIFVLPEVIHCPEELAKPCGQRAPVNVGDESTYNRIKAKMNPLWNKFLADAGLEDEETSSKCLRKELTTNLLSAGSPPAVVARVLGNKVLSLQPYDFPEDWQLACVRDAREQLLQTIREGGDADFVLTEQQLLTKMQDFLGRYLSAMVRLASNRHREFVDRLRAAAAAAAVQTRDEVNQLAAASSGRHEVLRGQVAVARQTASELRGQLEQVSQTLGLDPDDEFGRALAHYLGRPVTDQELERARSTPWPPPGQWPDDHPN